MYYLGVDISKDKFDVCLSDGHQYQTGVFENGSEGFVRLSRWLTKRQAKTVMVGMEATGRYWEALATYLFETGHQVSVLNPKIIKKYGESKLQRNKTDRLDAKLIAEYVCKEQPYLWQPTTAAQSTLKALTRHLNDLLEAKTRQTNRLKAGNHPPFIKDAIQETIEFLDKQIEDTESEIEKLLEQNQTLLSQHQLLVSIPGIAFRSAAIILAEMPQPNRFASPKQLTAYAGLTPQQLQSGKMNRASGMIKLGNKHLRKALYFPALVGMRYNPILKQYAENLALQGKHKMTIIGALMRKLLHLIYGILKNQTLFDPNYLVNVRNTA